MPVNICGKVLWEVKQLAMLYQVTSFGMLITMGKQVFLISQHSEVGPSQISSNFKALQLSVEQELIKISTHDLSDKNQQIVFIIFKN